MALKPWYKVVNPREDLRDGRPLDASEFAVHLDHVRDGKAPQVYQNPEKFFERTFLTKNLTDLSVEVIRRLSGIKVETSATFNMTTQFGGGKTHALTLLYHLAHGGSEANDWKGVSSILNNASVDKIPKARTAVFVGTEFDSITGRGGSDGTPLRKTPWGEIAFQLGGEAAFKIVEEHEKQLISPSSEIIRKFLPEKEPALILVDELMNYISRNRKSGLATQLYNFIQNLSEEVRAHDNVVLAVSIPASELEMTVEDQSEYSRFKKLLDRVGKAVIMSAEEETAEIIRRRLFEWTGVPEEAKKVAAEYGDWIIEHKKQIPNWFPADNAKETFLSTYPFHPSVLSVFQRKWQQLPRFQQTRGVLRLLALWVSKAYKDGYKGAYKDPLIMLGSAPLDDPLFRAAIFEQLGESRLEGAVTTDITGKKEAFAVRLDKEAVDAIKKSRLHQKAATTIFFESNGGRTKTEATLSEVRLAVADPDMDIGNVETVLDALSESCYYLAAEKNNKYRFSILPNLNKLLADRRANVKPDRIEETVKGEIKEIFNAGLSVERCYFPEKSAQIPDRPALSVIIVSPDQVTDAKKVQQTVDQMTKEYGTSARTFKSALIWCIPDKSDTIAEEARKFLAWQDIQDEDKDPQLDDTQKHQLQINLKKAERDLKESVWRTYNKVMLLDKDNKWLDIDYGISHSSAADSLMTHIFNRLRQDGHVERDISPNFLIRYWPPAFKEWSTKAVRNTFFASPQFPRLLEPDSIKETIARGVSNAIFAYVGKTPDGKYKPFHFQESINASDIEISDDMFIITGEEAKKQIEPPKLTRLEISPANILIQPGKSHGFLAKGFDQHDNAIEATGIDWAAQGGNIDGKGVFRADKEEGNFKITASVAKLTAYAEVVISKEVVPPPPPPPPKPEEIKKVKWSGELQPQKWMNFYTKVLSKHVTSGALKITLNVEINQTEGISKQKIDEMKTALRELGMEDDIKLD